MKKGYRIKKLSSSRASSKASYKRAYEAQDAQIMSDLGYIPCSSCDITLVSGNGKALRSWGHSHNMSVKQYPELENDPKNFSPRCQDWGNRHGCHNKLDNEEFSEIIKFEDFHELMAYRKEHSREAYNQWVTKLKEIGYEEYDYID